MRTIVLAWHRETVRKTKVTYWRMSSHVQAFATTSYAESEKFLIKIHWRFMELKKSICGEMWICERCFAWRNNCRRALCWQSKQNCRNSLVGHNVFAISMEIYFERAKITACSFIMPQGINRSHKNTLCVWSGDWLQHQETTAN